MRSANAEVVMVPSQLDQLLDSGPKQLVSLSVDPHDVKSTFLSIDMDCLCGAVVPLCPRWAHNAVCDHFRRASVVISCPGCDVCFCLGVGGCPDDFSS